MVLQDTIQSNEQLTVRAFLVEGEAKIPWRWDTHTRIQIAQHHRKKRNVDKTVVEESIRISLDGLPNMIWNLNLRPKSHPVTPDTIVEWVAESGERTLTRGIHTENCWYLFIVCPSNNQFS